MFGLIIFGLGDILVGVSDLVQVYFKNLFDVYLGGYI